MARSKKTSQLKKRFKYEITQRGNTLTFKRRVGLSRTKKTDENRRMDNARRQIQRQMRSVIRKTRKITGSTITKPLNNRLLGHVRSIQRSRDYITCVSRKNRRRGLFAKRKIGRGIAGPKIRKFIEKSRTRCK